MKDPKGTNFTGVGNATTAGRWKIPCALRLEDSGVILPGGLDSHEMKGVNYPLLLSQSVQSKLGFIKDTRDGTIILKDYEHQHLEVVRQAKTGLYMIRIDHLIYDMYQDLLPPLQKLMTPIDKPATQKSTEQNSSDESSDERPVVDKAFVATDNSSRAFKLPQPIRVKKEDKRYNAWTNEDALVSALKKDTILVSCGFTNFEDSSVGNGASSEFRDNMPEKDSRSQRIYFEKNREAFEISFQKNFPELCAGRNIIVIDCTQYTDPGEDNSLRGHTGRHHKTMTRIVEDPRFKTVNEPLHKLLRKEEGKNLIISVCKVGRHRSVGNNELIAAPIARHMYGDDATALTIIDLQSYRHWSRLCDWKTCSACDSTSKRHHDSLYKAIDALADVVPRTPLPPPAPTPGKRMPARPSDAPRRPLGEKIAEEVRERQSRRPAKLTSSRTDAKAAGDEGTRRLQKLRSARHESPEPQRAFLKKREEVEEDTLDSVLGDLVQLWTQQSTFTVIEKLMTVFRPGTNVFDMLNAHSGPAGTLKVLLEEYNLELDVFVKMYEECGTRVETSASSTGTKRSIVTDPVRSPSASPDRRERSPITISPARKKPRETETSMLDDSYDDAMSPLEELSEEEDSGPEDPSDEPIRHPVGRLAAPVQYERPPWGGPTRGDDKDSTFLADDRTGEAKTGDSPPGHWSPDDKRRPKMLSQKYPVRDNETARREKSRRRARDEKSSRRERGRSRRNRDSEFLPSGKARPEPVARRKRGRTRSRTRSPHSSEGRSRSRPPVRLEQRRGETIAQREDSVGTGKGSKGSKGKGKDKGRKDSKGSKGDKKGKGKKPPKGKPVDDDTNLSPNVKQFHIDIVASVPESAYGGPDNKDVMWKDEFVKHYALIGEQRTTFCEGVFNHLGDLGKFKNKRIYIGPGRDGSSDDKIPVDGKYDPKNTRTAFNKTWKAAGYVKTSYGLYTQPDGSEQWKPVEVQVALDKETVLTSQNPMPSKLVALLHPGSSEPKGLDEDHEECAHVAIDPDFDFEEQEAACFYCGEDYADDPSKRCRTCTTCHLNICGNCDKNVSCSCFLAEDHEVVFDSFTPKPGDGKTTTLSKSMKKRIQATTEELDRQDDAMWSTLRNKPHRLNPTKKCLLAITAFSSLFQGAIGHTARLINPGFEAKVCTNKFIADLRDEVDEKDPSLIYLHVPFKDDEVHSKGYCQLKDFAEEQIKAGRTCVIADTRHTDRWEQIDPTKCKGDLAFHCNDTNVRRELVEWARVRDNGNPRCTDDLGETQFADVLAGIAEAHHLDKCVDAAFVGTQEAADEEQKEVLDAIYGPEDEMRGDEIDARDEEADLIEKIPLPGNPETEAKRKKIWLSLPRRARISIRRLHRNFKHLPKTALVQMLRAAKVPKEFIEAAKAHRCDVCEQTKPPRPTHKVSKPKPYVFNHEVGVDVLEIKDAAGTFYDILNVVDYGTTFEQAGIVRVGDTNGVPSSSNCLKWFVNGWVRPFGWPKFVAGDRGTHNRGVFMQTLSKKGVRFNPAALESPEHIGRVERRNQTLKRMLNKVIKETNATGQEQVDMCLTECITAINELSRHGGFAPVQWVLAKFPRQPATLGDEEEAHDIGAIQAHVDGPTEFALQARYRLAAREQFVKWDCGEKVQRALLRNATAIPGPYKTGDIVSYSRRARNQESGIQWSVGSRIVGFEYDKNPGEGTPTPYAAWVICDGLSVLVSLDKIRPCTAAELLAYQFMHGEGMPRTAVSPTNRQQSFIDERDVAPPPTPKRSRSEVELHSPRDSGTAQGSSSAAQRPRAEQLPPVPSFPEDDDDLMIDDATAKELRANSPQPTSNRNAEPPRQSPKRDASPAPLVEHLKRNRVSGKGVEMLEKIAYLFDEDLDKEMCQKKVGFLQVRLAPPKPKKTPARKPPKKKDGEKNLSFASCDPEVQEGLRKTRVKEWEKWQQFNAGVILSKDEVNKLRDEGVQIHPMQWIETDKNAHLRRADKFVPRELKSRLVGCGNFEDTQGLRTDSPTGDVDSHNLVFSWCSSNKVKIKSADISNAYLQGKENDRVILYRIPKGGIPEAGVYEGDVLAARVPIYGTKDAGRGFWLRLKEVVVENGYSLNQILPTMFSLRHEGKIVGTMSSNVDDLLYGSLPEHENVMNKILDTFSVRERNIAPFRFCGKEVQQSEDYSITVTAKDNTEKIRPIDIGEKRKGSDKCNASETTCLRSVVASLAWIARQVRPGLSYRVSKLQSVAGKGTIKDMRECNKVLEYAQGTSTEGIHFASEGISWDDAVVTSISDASFCNEKIVIDGVVEDDRSQQGYLICLAPAGIVNMMQAVIHPLGWSSTHIHRICRSTLMAETFALNKAIEAGTRLRAAIVDMKGLLDIRNWEESAALAMGHCWMTDCESLYEHLMSQRLNTIENKRLAIDLKALRQFIWERSGDRTLEVDCSCGDYPRWIDTSVMLADPLTKNMKPDRLVECMMTGKFDLRPTAESLMIKEKNRAYRKATSEAKKQKANPVANEAFDPDYGYWDPNED